MTSPIITEAVRRLVDRRDLSRLEAAAAMDAIMSGSATNAQIAAFLTALRMKGETVEELTGLLQAMRSFAEAVPVADDLGPRLVDTCGTGGDRDVVVDVLRVSVLRLARWRL